MAQTSTIHSVKERRQQKERREKGGLQNRDGSVCDHGKSVNILKNASVFNQIIIAFRIVLLIKFSLSL